MIDLKNTWIKKEDSVLQAAWVSGCIMQGLVLFTEDCLGDAIYCDGEHIMSTSVEDEVDASVRKEITLRDLVETQKPQVPKTKVEYLLVEESLFDLRGEFESGVLYWNINTKALPEYEKVVVLTELAFYLMASNLFRKVETEILWYDNLPVEGVLCWVKDREFEQTSLQLVLAYDIKASISSPFMTQETSWRIATPLTQDEIKVFLNNVPN